MVRLEGQKISKIETIGSMYNDQCIVLVGDDGIRYRMKVSELNKVLNDLTFNVEKKKVHNYLTIDQKSYVDERNREGDDSYARGGLIPRSSVAKLHRGELVVSRRTMQNTLRTDRGQGGWFRQRRRHSLAARRGRRR